MKFKNEIKQWEIWFNRKKKGDVRAVKVPRMREDEEWLYYGCENMKSLAVFVRARRHLEILFLNFQFLKIKKKRGKWVGKK